MMAAATHLLLPFLAIFLILSTTTKTISAVHNITAILSAFPEYASYNAYLTQTRVADDINTRQTITVLVLTNSVATSAFTSNTLDSIKTQLSIHVLLDYFDATKLHNIPDGSVVSTTLHQTTGVAKNRDGFVKLSDSKGKVLFKSESDDTDSAKVRSVFVKSVKAIPYNISVIEISQPINVPGVLTPEEKDLNITSLLEGAGCKTFARMISQKAEVLKLYNSAMQSGLTVFAPRDDAWKKKGLPDWKRVEDGDLFRVLMYHATPNYFPMATLKKMMEGFNTLATIGADRYAITPESSGDLMILKSGVDDAAVVSTVKDSAPVVIYTIDRILLPVEVFGNSSKSPPPAHSPSSGPAVQPGSPPVVVVEPPTQGPGGNAPSKAPAKPAPAVEEGPGGAPVEGPAADEEDKKKNGVSGKGSEMSTTALIMAMVMSLVSVALI